MSSYRISIDQTTQTIDRRSKYYRNLIVTVTFVGLGTISLAVIVRSWLPLVGTLLLVPLCGLYLLIDGQLLNHWRNKLMLGWEKGDIDFNAFHQALMAISTLPQNTVKSMLATLPVSGDLVAEQGVSSSTRTAIAAIVYMIHTCRSDLIVLKTAAYTIAGGAVAIAAAFWMWQPLLGLLPLGLIGVLQKGIKTRRLKSAKATIVAVQQQPDFNLDKFREIIGKIDWPPISATEKMRFLGEL
jgi:hypothetical protein